MIVGVVQNIVALVMLLVTFVMTILSLEDVRSFRELCRIGIRPPLHHSEEAELDKYKIVLRVLACVSFILFPVMAFTLGCSLEISAWNLLLYVMGLGVVAYVPFIIALLARMNIHMLTSEL